MDVKVVGVDIAKRYFQVHGIDGAGAVVPSLLSRFYVRCEKL